MDLDDILNGLIIVCSAVIAVLPNLKIGHKNNKAKQPKISRIKRGKGSSDTPHSTIVQENTLILRIILIACAAIIIVCSLWESNRVKHQNIEYNSNIQGSREDIKSLKYIIDTLSVDPAEKVNEGFALSGILTIHDVPENRRKFIFDFGESLYKNRVSLYLDNDNSIVLRVLDTYGETFSVKAIHDFITFKKEARYFLYCDIGYTEEYSFIRIFLDDRQLARENFNSKIMLEDSIATFKNLHIGSDLEGKNNGKFSISFFSAGKLLTYKQRIFEMRDVIKFITSMEKDDSIGKYKGFNVGDSFMKTNSKPLIK